MLKATGNDSLTASSLTASSLWSSSLPVTCEATCEAWLAAVSVIWTGSAPCSWPRLARLASVTGALARVAGAQASGTLAGVVGVRHPSADAQPHMFLAAAADAQVHGRGGSGDPA